MEDELFMIDLLNELGIKTSDLKNAKIDVASGKLPKIIVEYEFIDGVIVSAIEKIVR